MNAVYKYTFCVYFSYVSRYLTYPAILPIMSFFYVANLLIFDVSTPHLACFLFRNNRLCENFESILLFV